MNLIVILGCSILSIMNDRLKTTLKLNIQPNDIFLLTGGNKYNSFIISEANYMYSILSKHYNNEFILDEKSKNTAENIYFIQKMKWNNTITIITSYFHQHRVQLITNELLHNINITWNLSYLYHSIAENEHEYIKNIYHDIYCIQFS